MKSKVGKPFEQIKAEMMEAIKSIDLDDENDPWEFEFMQEMNARKLLYSLLSPEEVKRWDFIQVLFQTRDNERIARYNYFKSEETERVESYYKASLMSAGDFEKYLICEIQKLDLKITKYSFGRELLEHYTQEKFLLLFNDGNHYKPLNLSICEIDERKDERGVKDKLIKLFAKEKALLHILMNLDNSLPTNLHLKDVTKSDAHYESIIKTLLDEGIIYEIGEGKYSFKRSKQFSVRDLAHFINSLYSFGFLKFEISKEQGITISKNTFGYEYSTGYAGETDFMPKQYEWLKNLILNNLLNTSE